MQQDVVLKQMDVFDQLLARLFNLQQNDDLDDALYFVQQHIDHELLLKLNQNPENYYRSEALQSEIEFLIHLKCTELELLEKGTDHKSTFNCAVETLNIISEFIEANRHSYLVAIENRRASIRSKINKWINN